MSLLDDLPLSVQVSKKIEDDIVYGRLPPGTKLDEAKLCEKILKKCKYALSKIMFCYIRRI